MEADILTPRISAIRVGVCSEDSTLPNLLSPVLGPEFLPVAAGPVDSRGENQRFDALIMDFNSDSQGAKEFFRNFTAAGAAAFPPIIIMAGDESRREALELVERGAHGYVRKPPAVRELRALLRSAHEKRSLKGELAAVKRQLENAVGLDQLIGSSAAMQLVYKLIRKVASLENSVLIAGESGTGKELIARGIHNTGTRSKRPFVAVSCGAIPENLIEAELFGHEKGAFTGSIGTREGYFEKAGDGTLFLDEIGELSLPTQVKLLRVLQEREFSRLGSGRSIPLRARLVFATHRDLEQMVAEGTFRQDLYYRINVMKIECPVLRDHLEDIPGLVHHFFRKYTELYRKPLEGIEPDALALLQAYTWPGNVRELENVMQRVIIMAEGYSIETTDLPPGICDQFLAECEGEPLAGSFEHRLREFKFKLASEAVQQCNGNKTLAAQSLSISRAYLHRLLRVSPAGGESVVTDISSKPSAITMAAGQ